MPIDIANMVVNLGQNDSKSWIDVSSALLTPIIAIFMALIAYRQWQTEERKRKQDLYEKRYELFDSLYQAISNIKDFVSKENSEVLTEEILKILNKYQFLINKEDFVKLRDTYNKIVKSEINYIQKQGQEKIDAFSEHHKERENNDKIIYDIMSYYLLIEKEPKNLWQILCDFFVKSYYFLAIDKILKFFFSKFRKNKTGGAKCRLKLL